MWGLICRCLCNTQLPRSTVTDRGTLSSRAAGLKTEIEHLARTSWPSIYSKESKVRLCKLRHWMLLWVAPHIKTFATRLTWCTNKILKFEEGFYHGISTWYRYLLVNVGRSENYVLYFWRSLLKFWRRSSQGTSDFLTQSTGNYEYNNKRLFIREIAYSVANDWQSIIAKCVKSCEAL